MATAFEGRYPGVNVEYTMIPMTNGEYQTKLLASLGTADAPDVVALEAAFVKEYVESDFLADLGDLLPLAEELGTYPFVIDVGTNDGVTKAYSNQATPGALFYRRSLAKEYFGTDDPAEIQELIVRHGQVRRSCRHDQREVRLATPTWSHPAAISEPVPVPIVLSRGLLTGIGGRSHGREVHRNRQTLP